MRARPADVLQDMWRGLRDDASPRAKAWVSGAIAFAERTGALSAEQSELWRLRLATCPGHDDEGGRDWCAYCGVMPREASNG